MKLANLFGDHAVLQRDISVPVWGTTKPQTKVVVNVGPYTAQTLSSADGSFIVRLPPMKAGGPYVLEACATDSDERFVAQDIWIGEVWLASGQSNMEFTFTQLRQDESPDAKESIPGVRMATVARRSHLGRQKDVAVFWEVAGPETTKSFSAVAFHFARQLHQDLGVAVGIINASWGGTIIEAWTSRETLINNDDARPWITRYEASVNSPEYWQRQAKALETPKFPLDPGNQGFARGWATPELDDHAWQTMKIPGPWTAQGHPHSGAFWFRKQIEVPQSWAGKELILCLGAADKHDVTYFNGKEIGRTGSGLEEACWNQARQYRVPGTLVKAGKNVITSRVYSFVHAGGLIGPAKAMHIAPADAPQQAIGLAGDWKYTIEHNVGVVAIPQMEPGLGNPNSPYILYDNMIAPLIPYALRGAIWYQGESNADEPQKYLRFMRDMIRCWRQAWGQGGHETQTGQAGLGDFQFIMVQLANFNTEAFWPLLRESQFKSLAEPNTGMAVAIDIGNPVDIHPENKQDVGKRLALWALAGSYGKAIECSGPLYSGFAIEGDAIRIRFAHTAQGLVVQDGHALRNLVIAGSDRKFVPANAVIDGNSILVSSPSVSLPMAVRFAWENNPEGFNFYNSAGLPASPFRTDTW